MAVRQKKKDKQFYHVYECVFAVWIYFDIILRLWEYAVVVKTFACSAQEKNPFIG